MPNKFKYNWKEFTLQAAFKGTPEKLFRMWTEPKLLCKWFFRIDCLKHFILINNHKTFLAKWLH